MTTEINGFAIGFTWIRIWSVFRSTYWYHRNSINLKDYASSLYCAFWRKRLGRKWARNHSLGCPLQKKGFIPRAFWVLWYFYTLVLTRHFECFHFYDLWRNRCSFTIHIQMQLNFTKSVCNDLFFPSKPTHTKLVFGHIKYNSNFCNETFKPICKSKKPKPSLDKLDYSANSQLESAWHFQKN